MSQVNVPINRRVKPQRRQIYGRRRSDAWKSFGKLAAVIASGTGAVLGQAELLGEPIRHYVTIVCVGSLGVSAYLLGPENVRVLWQRFKKAR